MLFHASCFQPLTLNLPLNKHDGSLLGSSEDTIAQKEMSRQYVLSHPGIPVQHGSYVQTESPTTSPFRVRWSEIYEWTSLPYDITDYMNNLTAGELATIVDPGRLMVTLANLIISLATKEEHLKRPLDRYYWTTHELAAQPDGATHVHAKVEVPGGEHALTGDPDYIFLHDDYAVGIIELKTFWKVTPQTIDEVLNGSSIFVLKFIDLRGRSSKPHPRPSWTACSGANIRIYGLQCETIRYLDNRQWVGFHVSPKWGKVVHVACYSLRRRPTAAPDDRPSTLLRISPRRERSRSP
jgi:hypothetical protein